MAATLTHELQQPLASIANYAAACSRLLEDDRQLDVDLVREGVTGIVEGSLRAREIITHLKHMIARGRPVMGPMSLPSAIKEAADLSAGGACDGLDIVIRDTEAVMIVADRVQIQQVMINLLRNACEAVATAECKRIVVAVTADGDNAVVSVEDNGPGILPEHEKSLFQWSDSSKAEGMGIGLAIARAIVEAHDGRIWLDANGEGTTRISFSIPLRSSALPENIAAS